MSCRGCRLLISSAPTVNGLRTNAGNFSHHGVPHVLQRVRKCLGPIAERRCPRREHRRLPDYASRCICQNVPAPRRPRRPRREAGVYRARHRTGVPKRMGQPGRNGTYKWSGNGKGGEIRTLDYARLVCPLWQSCKAMLMRIEQLEQRVAQLS